MNKEKWIQQGAKLMIVALILIGCAQAQVQIEPVMTPTSTMPIPSTTTAATPTPASTATSTLAPPTFTPTTWATPTLVPMVTSTPIPPTLTPTTLAGPAYMLTTPGVAQVGQQQASMFETELKRESGTREGRFNYLLFLPKNYGTDPQQKWPLILFLHGLGETGNDVEIIKKHGIPKIVEQQADFPFITVSPQCSYRFCWESEADTLLALLDEVTATYAVDTQRIYLTGLSMGGYGAWYLAMKSPDRFAAVAPIAGGGDPKKVCALKDVPVWAFHGVKDDVVPVQESEKMVEALQACGGNVKFTLYPNVYHDSWTQTYDNPELYEWFLQYTR